jgi:hypothetical protein
MYGRLTSHVYATPNLRRATVAAAETPEQKMAALAQQLAALVPGEVLIIHAAVLAAATSADQNGSTTVTNPELLKWTLPVLAGVAFVLFLIGRLPNWNKTDFVRMLIPPSAFFAWTLIIGTSAATPWCPDLDRGWLLLIGGALGAVLVGLSVRLTPRVT